MSLDRHGHRVEHGEGQSGLTKHKTCQDWFNSEEELRELELLNNIQDLASLCVMCPCLNSPQCPEIGRRVRKGWRWST